MGNSIGYPLQDVLPDFQKASLSHACKLVIILLWLDCKKAKALLPYLTICLGTNKQPSWPWEKSEDNHLSTASFPQNSKLSLSVDKNNRFTAPLRRASHVSSMSLSHVASFLCMPMFAHEP